MSDLGVTHSTVIVDNNTQSSVTGITNGTTTLINNVKIIGDGTTANTNYNSTNNEVTISAIIPANNAVQSVSAGDGITVNNTDPKNPIISNIGVRSITAGSNITIDNSNPRIPIISTTGSGITSVTSQDESIAVTQNGTNVDLSYFNFIYKLSPFSTVYSEVPAYTTKTVYKTYIYDDTPNNFCKNLREWYIDITTSYYFKFTHSVFGSFTSGDTSLQIPLMLEILITYEDNTSTLLSSTTTINISNTGTTISVIQYPEFSLTNPKVATVTKIEYQWWANAIGGQFYGFTFQTSNNVVEAQGTQTLD